MFCNDGRTVYIKTIQSLSYGTWVKGSLNHDGTAITVPLPQDLSQDAVISMGFVGDVNGIFYCLSNMVIIPSITSSMAT